MFLVSIPPRLLPTINTSYFLRSLGVNFYFFVNFDNTLSIKPGYLPIYNIFKYLLNNNDQSKAK